MRTNKSTTNFSGTTFIETEGGNPTDPKRRSDKDDEKYDGEDFNDADYNGKNYKEEDDYNSGKLGRAADETDENNLKNIPRRNTNS